MTADVLDLNSALIQNKTLIFEDADILDPEYVKAVWARRAARLAQVPVQEDEGERTSLVLVQLGQEIYGLEAQYVFDIRPVQHITPIPRTPLWVVGIVNLRGRIISVLDLRRFFGLPELPTAEGDQTPQSYLVVVQTDTMEIALLTDSVLTVRSVPINQIQQVPDAMMLNIRPDYVRGFIPNYESSKQQTSTTSDLHAERNNGTMLVILNLPTLLADKHLIIDEDLI